MQVYTLPDITPNGAKVNIGATATANGMPTKAIIIDMCATGTSVRTGDTNIGASRGVKLSNGATVVAYPRQDNPQTPWDLNLIDVYAGSGSDSVSITYGL